MPRRQSKTTSFILRRLRRMAILNSSSERLEFAQFLLGVDDDPDAPFFLERTPAPIGVVQPVHNLFGGEAIRYLETAVRGMAAFPGIVCLDIKRAGSGS